ncbi:hypothetical protein CVIRNUC_002987 [Coccomyxa viridis]|uniref:Cwf15/Cwc15 cell cycle control protein n=1 Tax=Coccomyxa viridis TaxID=1274662 RepID=A0AAV1HZ69_9CHLO|nr:hypothetical protein CVIRNUC_002987 [Coccomyxa viridis]
MTTAHRPTWQAAKGGEEQGGMRIYAASHMTSAKDQISQTKMKFRQPGQTGAGGMTKAELQARLEESERDGAKDSEEDFAEALKKDMKLLDSSTQEAGKGKTLVPKAIDADDEDDPGEADDDSEDDDEEAEEAELLAELARIKREREQEAARAAAEEAAAAQSSLQQELVKGNPLIAGKLGGGADFQVKRRWDDDVVFRNQERGEPKAQKRFVNDTIRNDFHRRFLNRYIK